MDEYVADIRVSELEPKPLVLKGLYLPGRTDLGHVPINLGPDPKS